MPEADDEAIRELIIGRYRLIDRTGGTDTVEIIAVVDAARDVRRLLP